MQLRICKAPDSGTWRHPAARRALAAPARDFAVSQLKKRYRRMSELGSRWHIHLAEQKDDVSFARERFGATPLRVLEIEADGVRSYGGGYGEYVQQTGREAPGVRV